MREKLEWHRWWMVVVFAAAMAWVEAAVVVYLRTLIDRLQPYQPDPLPMIGGLAEIEIGREAATLIMLVAVGWLAGRTRGARWGYTAVAFGVWDIFYYVWLYLLRGWPGSLLDWDLLFLIPLPWWAPVLAPIAISLLLIGGGTLCCVAMSASRWLWGAGVLGAGLALYTFMADGIQALPRGAVRSVLPQSFDWPLFALGFVWLALPVLEMAGARLRVHAAQAPTNRAQSPWTSRATEEHA